MKLLIGSVSFLQEKVQFNTVLLIVLIEREGNTNSCLCMQYPPSPPPHTFDPEPALSPLRRGTSAVSYHRGIRAFIIKKA